MSVWITGTILAAILERWWFPAAWDETALPASRFYFGDARAFLGYAVALSAGEPFDNGIPFHPPGWPLVLAVVFRVFGWSIDEPFDPIVLKHVSAVISGISVGLTALLAYTLGGRGVMVITSLLGIFHFGHMAQAAAPNSEPLYGALMTLVLFGAVHSRVPALAIGLLAGFTALVRVEFVLCAGLLAIWLAFDQRSLPRRSAGDPRAEAGRSGGDSRLKGGAALFALGCVLALLPTTILNWQSIDDFNRTRSDRMPGPLPRFAPITSYGAFNFANANHERAEGGFNWDLPSLESSEGAASDLLAAGQLDLARPQVYRAYVDGYRIGATWIVSNPGEAIALFGKKLAIMLSVFDFGYSLDNVPVRVRGTRRPVDQIDLESSWITVAHVVLVVSGLWIAAMNASTRVLLPPVITLLASSLLFFGYVRLGVAYLPVIWILQALSLTRFLAAIPVAPLWRHRAAFAVAALAGLLLLAERAAVDRPRVLMIDGVADDQGRFVEDQKMEIVRVR